MTAPKFGRIEVEKRVQVYIFKPNRREVLLRQIPDGYYKGLWAPLEFVEVGVKFKGSADDVANLLRKEVLDYNIDAKRIYENGRFEVTTNENKAVIVRPFSSDEIRIRGKLHRNGEVFDWFVPEVKALPEMRPVDFHALSFCIVKNNVVSGSVYVDLNTNPSWVSGGLNFNPRNQSLRC